MRLVLASAGSFDALLLDGWRIPRASVRPLQNAAAVLQVAGRRASELEAERAATFAAARAQGFQAGLAEGRAEAEAIVAEAVAGLARALNDLRRELRGGVADLALEAVRRLAGEIDEAQLLARIVETTVREVMADQPFAVRVRPEAAQGLRDWAAASGSPLRIIVDEDVEPGVCVVETRTGRVRAGLQVQLQALSHAFRASPHLDGDAS